MRCYAVNYIYFIYHAAQSSVCVRNCAYLNVKSSQMYNVLSKIRRTDRRNLPLQPDVVFGFIVIPDLMFSLLNHGRAVLVNTVSNHCLGSDAEKGHSVYLTWFHTVHFCSS